YSYLWSRSPHDTTTSIYVKESGTYSVFAIDSTGECYGKSQEIWITNAPLPDTTVTVQNNILTATENAQGTTYQWIDCETNMPTGETSQTFTPVQNGDYAVILTSVESCVDTSACYTITTVGIENNLSLNDQITVYPNPTNGKLYVETDLDIKELTIFDLQGKKLLTSNTKEIDILGLPTSVYILEITLLDNEQWRTKVIKE
ncbi:MAG: T9SS type A sorting domain-containing protein, partial [Candidatus Carbobacillus sp.]|nr:T9SS type A sorting domain-containing protein [Candidatus Carbobacillus sp.]